MGTLSRRIIVTAIATAGVLTSAAPAIAKAIELREVTIRGPDLSRPLVLSQRQFGIPRSQSDARVGAAFGLLDPEGNREVRPSGELGMGFDLTYKYRSSLDWEHRLFWAREILYPYAPEGPVAFVPPGQSWRVGKGTPEQKIPTGWRSYPPPVVRNLQEHGLPVVKTAHPTVEPTEVQRPRALLWIPTFAAVAALAAGAWLHRGSDFLRTDGHRLRRLTKLDPETAELRALVRMLAVANRPCSRCSLMSSSSTPDLLDGGFIMSIRECDQAAHR